MKFYKAVCVCALFSVSPAWGLDTDRVAPKVPEPASGEIVSPEDVPVDDTDALRQREFLPALNGLVFVDDVAGIQNQGRDVEGVLVENLPMLNEQFVALMQRYIGKPVSLHTLDLINRDVVLWMRDHDYPVVDALAPAGQDITNGVLQLVVMTGKLGQVSAEGARYYPDEKIAKQFAINEGEPLREQALNRELEWANRNPFRSVNLVLQPGDDPGQADVELAVEDKLPLRVYTGIEDTGSELTGDERWLLGANWGDAFNLDHQLNYQLVRALEAKRLTAHSLSYIAPLPWRHTLSVNTSYITSDPDEQSDVDIRSRTAAASLQYQMPWLRRSNLKLDGVLGYDFKRSNNNLEFGGVDVYDTDVDVSQFTLGVSSQFSDRFGDNGLFATYYFSPGSMTPYNSDDEFQAARADAEANYQYIALGYNRLTPLGYWLNWNLEVSGQVSDGNLLGSEQFGIGGYASVRGYDEYVATGDLGFYARNELRGPAWQPLQKLGLNAVSERLVLLGFVDAGSVDVNDALPGEGHTQLSSFGVGARYWLGPWLTARVDYGWQMQKAPNEDERDGRVHFSLVASY